MKKQTKTRVNFVASMVAFVVLAVIAYPKLVSFWPWAENTFSSWAINQGLDLQGGIHLEYAADVSQIENDKVDDAMQAVQAVVERRVNAFGVGEPVVQISNQGTEHRVIVELPGIKNIEGAKAMIQETPFLEFREQAPDSAQEKFDKMNEDKKKQAEKVLKKALAGDDFATLADEYSEDPSVAVNHGDLGFVAQGSFVSEFDEVIFKDDFQVGTVYPELVESQFGWHIIKKEEVKDEDGQKQVRSAHILLAKDALEYHPEEQYVATGLSGKNLKSVAIDYQSQGLGNPQVALTFDSEGATLLAEVSKRNVGKPLAIFIDHQVFSAPIIQQELTGGQAVVTSNFTPETVKEYVKRLNEGALPVPIALVAQQSVDASLGSAALEKSLWSGLIGLAAVSIFMLLFYRFLGLIAVFAVLFYTALLVVIFKLSAFTPFAITVTLSGIAGFVLSIGIAVDANILIFERFREELAYGKSVVRALEQAFDRAWPSIRDGHISTLITTFILMISGTGFVKGFAIILALGVLVSLFTAVVLVRAVQRFLITDWFEGREWMLATPKHLPEATGSAPQQKQNSKH